MTGEQFLKSKEPNTYIFPSEWLDEYASLVLSIAAEKAEVNVKDYNDYEVDKKSILNCLKDK